MGAALAPTEGKHAGDKSTRVHTKRSVYEDITMREGLHLGLASSERPGTSMEAEVERCGFVPEDVLTARPGFSRSRPPPLAQPCLVNPRRRRGTVIAQRDGRDRRLHHSYRSAAGRVNRETAVEKG